MSNRFDNIVESEEKKAEKRKKSNAFVRSNSTLKSSNATEQEEVDNNFQVEKEPESQPEVEEKAEEEQKKHSNLVIDKSGKLDVKALINSKDGDSKSYSLYLKKNTYKKLEKIAKSQNVSVSKALNDILDSIL